MGRFLSSDDSRFHQAGQSEGGLNPLEQSVNCCASTMGELGGIVAQHWQLPERMSKGSLITMSRRRR
jgi:hypothetical protein